MKMRIIGIGIVALVLILAISMTASADPEPEGATPGYMGSWVTNGTGTGTFTDGHALNASTPMEIQLLVTTAVSGGDLKINISYSDQGGNDSENTTMINLSDGTSVDTYHTVTLNSGDTGVTDVTMVYVNATTSTATLGDFVIVATEKATADAAGSTEVRGGYISSMDLSATPQTCNWAGYFGEVTGTLTLEDSTGDLMYSWDAADIGGEVYASNASSITWSSIVAENVSDVDGALTYMSASMSDSVTNTFTNDSNTAIDVGTVTIVENTAASTYMFVDGITQSDDFEEVILHDGTNIVWTAIICPNTEGFETGDATHDYQMIVPEDGSGNTVAETYYFYVELA